MSRQQVAKTGRDRYYYRGNCNRVKLRGASLKDLTADLLEDKDCSYDYSDYLRGIERAFVSRGLFKISMIHIFFFENLLCYRNNYRKFFMNFMLKTSVQNGLLKQYIRLKASYNGLSNVIICSKFVCTHYPYIWHANFPESYWIYILNNFHFEHLIFWRKIHLT